MNQWLDFQLTRILRMTIERKPVPNGFVIYVICGCYLNTNRPFVLHMIPNFGDISVNTKLSTKNVFNKAMNWIKLAQKQCNINVVSVTVDSLFGHISQILVRTNQNNYLQLLIRSFRSIMTMEY